MVIEACPGFWLDVLIYYFSKKEWYYLVMFNICIHSIDIQAKSY